MAPSRAAYRSPRQHTTMTDLGDLFLRLGLDGAAIVALAYGIYLPRHRNMDLVVVYGLFNLGLFLAIVVITRGSVTLGVGLGLFAVLSMIRLRSETFSNRELAYFFIALVLALVTAIDLGSVAFAGVLAGVALLAAWVIDHPRLTRPTQQLEATLEVVLADRDALRRHLEERLLAQVVDMRVLDIDYVRETTRVAVRYVAANRPQPVREESPNGVIAFPRR
jgi:Domain of unknown function (DUF4956)